jgi:2-polyprenyl-3-methyl-5-hydroxy-6-metoxy-1,4-benzoquinol methylase
MKCPICENTISEQLLKLKCGEFDQSTLYRIIRIQGCRICGHIFNKITKKEYLGILNYYEQEAAELNLNNVSKDADLPGNYGKFAKERYQILYSKISSFLKKEDKILDIGCATGGFLTFLNEKGYKNLYGIDFVKKYTEIAQKNESLRIEFASAEKLPYKQKTFDFIVVDHTLEHIWKLKKVIKEIRYLIDTYKTKQIMFLDDNFTVDKNRVI